MNQMENCAGNYKRDVVLFVVQNRIKRIHIKYKISSLNHQIAKTNNLFFGWPQTRWKNVCEKAKNVSRKRSEHNETDETRMALNFHSIHFANPINKSQRIKKNMQLTSFDIWALKGPLSHSLSLSNNWWLAGRNSFCVFWLSREGEKSTKIFTFI